MSSILTLNLNTKRVFYYFKIPISVSGFNIKLDTHSSDLDQYKLEAIVSLRDEKGKEYANPVVESPSGSGHHRSGVVRFKGVDISGATVVELVIKDMAGAKERVFRFEIK